MNRNQLLRTAALAVGACSTLALSASAQGLFITSPNIIATENDQAPGLPLGVTFGSTGTFDSGTLDDNGYAFFRGRLFGAGVTPTTERALFYGSTRSNLTLAIRSGDPVPTLSGGETLNTATGNGPGGSPRLAANGQMFWCSNMTGGTTTTATDTAIFTGTIGSYVIAAREGDPAPGTAGATISSSIGNLSHQPTGMNSSGRILFQSATAGGDTTTANNAAWFGGTPGNLELIFRKGHTLVTGEIVGALGFVSQQNASGAFIHDETLSTVIGTPPATSASNGTLWIYTPGSLPGTGTNTLIAREGDPAVGTVGAVYGQSSAFSNPFGPGSACFNNNGEAVLMSNLFGGDVVGTTNEFAVYRASIAGGMQMIFRKGDQAPGLPAGVLLGNPNTSSIVYNNNGRFAMQISLGGTATTADDSSVWTGTSYADMQMIAREGDPALGTVGATLGNMSGLGNFYLNDCNQVTFMAQTIGGDTTATNSQVYYGWSQGTGLTLLIRAGSLMEVQTGVFRTIATWGGIQFSNGDGRGLSFNDAGRLLMRLNWNTPTDPTNNSVIATVDVPCATPSTVFCSGDAVGTTCLGCGNNGAAGRGCANSSFANGTQLTTSGVASLSNDTLVLTTTDMPGPGLFFQANGLAASPITFGDGMLCASVGIIRMGVVFPSPTFTASYPGGLTPFPVSVAGAPINPGDTKHYQCWYRDSAAFCTTDTFNTSNGRTLSWAP